ncbi:MAG: DUF4107 domain-containing protein [Clostridiaceae bacterium]|jgi:hypothetical protein|nr:DUF4107 domain-containing protein [Clostridiaceae bacterium]
MWLTTAINAASVIKNRANAIDEATGGRASKFLKKYTGKIIGSVVKRVTHGIGKPELSEKVANFVDKGAEVSKEVLGNDNVITQNLSNAVSNMKVTPISPIPADTSNNALLNYQQPLTTGFYNRNIGGTNFQRYRLRRRGSGKRVKVSKFAKKKRQNKF